MLNVTPDSFSDGGHYFSTEAAVSRGLQIVEQGALVIDVGGESTRVASADYGEGFSQVELEAELKRVVPVIRRLHAELPSGARISVDTTKAGVARACLEEGATIVNDVSCASSEELMTTVAEFGAELVIMHNRETGDRRGALAEYSNATLEVKQELLLAVDRAVSAGIDASRIWIDPGLGFAKNHETSRLLLRELNSLVELGFPVLVGASRKSFITHVLGQSIPPEERLGGSLAAALLSAKSGAHAVRVHDVKETAQAIAFWSAITTKEELR